MCSLFKAFHVPIAFHKVHYIGMEEGGQGLQDAQEHTRGVKREVKTIGFGLKIRFFILFFSSYLVLHK